MKRLIVILVLGVLLINSTLAISISSSVTQNQNQGQNQVQAGNNEEDNETEITDDCEWQCLMWSECINGTKIRSCTNVNNCTGEVPKESKSCKKGKENKVCCKITEIEDDKIKIEYEYEDENKCNSNEEETKEIVNKSLCKGKAKEEIKFEERIGIECPDDCECTGVVMKCELEDSGREMTIYASSGNIIIQIKGINMTTNVTLYKLNKTIYGNFSIGERQIILQDEIQEKIREKIKAKLENQNIILNEDGIYEVQMQKKARLFFLFPIKEKVQTQINAENGEFVKIKNPWWGFLAQDVKENIV